MASAPSNTLRIVLLGNAGSGKSSLANTLFGEDLFPVNHSPDSSSKFCTTRTKTVNGRTLRVIDAPGFLDSDPTSLELNPALLDCIAESAPGPHAFLIVMKMEEDFKVDWSTLDLAMSYFSQKALGYATLVFTHGDRLPRGATLEDPEDRCGLPWILLGSGQQRRHVIDSRHWNDSQDEYRNNRYQVEQLLQTIEGMVSANGGRFYANELLTGLSKSLEKKEDKLSSLKDVQMGIQLGAFLGAVVEGRSARWRLAEEKFAGGGDEPLSWWSTFTGMFRRVSTVKPVGPTWSKLTLAGFAFLAGKASQKWSSPTEAVRDMTEFSKEVEDLFVQMKKTGRAAKNVFSDSDSD